MLPVDKNTYLPTTENDGFIKDFPTPLDQDTKPLRFTAPCFSPF